MNYGDNWPTGPRRGAPAITTPPPPQAPMPRDRATRILAWEVRKLQQRIADILDASQSTDDAA
jgi:hypothetical protein